MGCPFSLPSLRPKIYYDTYTNKAKIKTKIKTKKVLHKCCFTSSAHNLNRRIILVSFFLNAPAVTEVYQLVHYIAF